MISIILIGRNEGWRLTKCLKSVYFLKYKYSRWNFDIIYVDSKSTDDSIERTNCFPDIRVFQITGVANSAIARNIGAKEAMGDILFFIDADMEINPEFLSHALDDCGKMKYDYVTGHLDDYFYTADDKFLTSQPRTYKMKLPENNQELFHNGGLCLVKKEIWDLVGGMNNKYRRSQDLDFTMRLKRQGVKLIRIPSLAANHHTLDYRNEKRMWSNLREGNAFYPGLIFREFFKDKGVIKRTFRANYSAIFLLLVLLGFLVTLSVGGLLTLIYGIILLFRSAIHTIYMKSTQSRMKYFAERIVFQFLLDVSFWIGVFFFYPTKHNFEYQSLK